MGAEPVGKIGKYDIVGIIGEGGMGIVYKAVDPLLGRMVAIKKMTSAFTEGSDLQQRFYFEARAVANLQHPNIVVVFDMGDEGGFPFLVMEYLTGDSLDHLIATRQELPLLRKLDIVIQVCHALHYAHEHELVHRDVKPANVIVMPDGRAKLLDFGIAHAANKGLTRTGQVLGTINYISPEQLSGGQVDARTDVFSTGVVLYQLLTYQLPFDAPHTAAIINRILHEPAAPLSAFLRDYPPELDEIVERAMAKAPADRYPTAAEMGLDLIRLYDRVKRDTLSAYVKQARACIAETNLQAAHDVLADALRLDTKHAIAKQLMYEVEQVMGKQQVHQEIERLSGDAEAALTERRFDDALQFVDAALAQDKTDTQLLSLRDRICQAKARKEKVGALLHLAATAQQAGELPMARRAVEDVIQLDPNDTQAKVLQAALLRQIEDEEKRRQMRQLLQVIHGQISARDFNAADALIRRAEQLDAADPELQAIKALAQAGQQQEARHQEIEALCADIQEALAAGDVTAACLKAERASRKYANEPELVKLKAVAEHRRDEYERDQHIQEQLAEAERLRAEGDFTAALKIIQRVAQRYAGEARVQSALATVRAQADDARLAQLRDEALRRADEEIARGDLEAATRLLQTAAARMPADPELCRKLQQVGEQAARESRERRIAAVEKKVAQLLRERDYARARLILDRASAELPDPRLSALGPRIAQEQDAFFAEVEACAVKAQRMLAEGRLDEAALFLAAQPAACEQVPQFAEVARAVAAQQERKRTQPVQRTKVSEKPASSTTTPASDAAGLSATRIFAPAAASPVPPLVTPASSAEPGGAAAATAAAPALARQEAAEKPAKTVERPPARRQPLRRIVMLSAMVLVVVAAVVLAYRYWPSRSPVRPSPVAAFVEITAAPWGTVKTITSASGEVLEVGQETPLRLELRPGNYTIIIVSPAGTEQAGSFVVRPNGPNVYRHLCEEVDVRKMVESY